MSIPANITQLLARPLGPRGSRGTVGSADPAAELTPVAAAVLAAIPAWWSARATRAGLAGEWADVHFAVDVTPPLVLVKTLPLEPDWALLTAEQVGAAYVESLASETRARHGYLAEGSYAYFVDEPGHELAWYAIAGIRGGDSE